MAKLGNAPRRKLWLPEFGEGVQPQMTVFLEGVAAQFYRGIGAEVQYIAPFARMNFFIGANNAGKSIVLSLIAEQVAGGVGPSDPTQRRAEIPIRVALMNRFSALGTAEIVRVA